MLIIPAVDIKDGECVRLFQGEANTKTVYSPNPVEMAKKWERLGAERIHLVDLDAAMETGSNLEVIYQIKKAVSCKVQMGGGVRSLRILEKILETGIDKVIIGTAILKTPNWVRQAVSQYADRLLAGIDAKNREVKLQGWKAGSGLLVHNVLKTVEEMGFQELIFTDISRDGSLNGPNIDATRDLMSQTKMGVYASGGVSQLRDFHELKVLESEGLKGCIVGKALYDGRIDFKEALAVTR